MRDRRTQLARIDRVRAIQLTLARAAEADAQAQAATENALGQRIAQLAAGVAPAPVLGAGFGMAAAAHYRDRLQQSALAAEMRVARAQGRVNAAIEATRSAERDSKAIEKLRARAEADSIVAAMRALEETPPARRGNRHEPC